METLGSRLKTERRSSPYRTQALLSKRLGCTAASISDWENDKYRPDGENLYQLTQVLNLNKSWLFEGKGEKRPKQTGENEDAPIYYEPYRFPLLNWIEAGKWSKSMDYDRDIGLEVSPYAASKDSFIMEVKGESMAPEFISGDKILVDPSINPVSGSYTIASLTGQNEVVFKQLVIEGDRKYLKAANPDWPDKFTQLIEPSYIIGVVKGKWKSY